MEKNIPCDVSSKDIRIKSFNHKTNTIEFKKVLSLVYKGEDTIFNLVTVDGSILLKCAGHHRVFNTKEKKYCYIEELESGIALTNNEKEVPFFVKKTNEKLPIVDMEVEDNSNYFSNGILSHNTTTGGNALKFYASQRFEVRKIETMDNGDEDAVANKVRIKCVKNKVAPPYKKGEFVIYFGKGIDKIDSLLSVAVNLEVIDKKGAWYAYGEEKIGQGADNVRKFLEANPEIASTIEKKCRDLLFKKLGNTITEEKPKSNRKIKDESIGITIPSDSSPESLAAQATS